MSGNKTLTIIKPNAVKKGFAGKIISTIEDGGFIIRAMHMTRMTKEQAASFYDVHRGKPFYNSLVDFMSSGPIFVAALEKDNAVSNYRKYIGATNPAEAIDGSIRHEYGESLQMNAVHGSDSDENAEREIAFFFDSNDFFS